MIDRKTWLVARREYVENIRTKTFWIGIFMLPVIYGLIFGAQIFLQGAKEVRPYAVIDRTENSWLSDAIERRADQGDVNAAGGPIIAELMKFAKEAEEGAPLSSVTAKIGPATERAMEQADSDVQRRFLELLGSSLEKARYPGPRRTTSGLMPKGSRARKRVWASRSTMAKANMPRRRSTDCGPQARYASRITSVSERVWKRAPAASSSSRSAA